MSHEWNNRTEGIRPVGADVHTCRLTMICSYPAHITHELDDDYLERRPFALSLHLKSPLPFGHSFGSTEFASCPRSSADCLCRINVHEAQGVRYQSLDLVDHSVQAQICIPGISHKPGSFPEAH